MTPESVGPLSRPVAVDHLPLEGLQVRVEATPEECAAIARDFKLPGVHALSGEYQLSGSPERVRVAGRVRATITQVCVVSLDPFESDLEEEVAVDFAAVPDLPGDVDADAQDEDAPDPIVNGVIDLGALTAEFLALGLDPYPRKPGVDFEYAAEDEGGNSPFAALGKLKGDR